MSPTCASLSAASSGQHHADRALDQGILRALWLTPEQLRACASSHRSPLVHALCRGLPGRAALSARPAGSLRLKRNVTRKSHRRHVGRSRLFGRRLAAQGAGLRGRRPVHEELGGRRHRRILHLPRGSDRRRVGRRPHRHRHRGGQLLRGVPRARVQQLPRPSTRPGARPIPMCCATPRSSSRHFSIMRWASARTGSPPATTPGCAGTRAGHAELLKAADASKDQSYFLYRLNQAQLSTHAVPARRVAQARRARAGAQARARQPRQARQHRHLLHRRAAVPGVSDALPAHRTGSDGVARTDAWSGRTRA